MALSGIIAGLTLGQQAFGTIASLAAPKPKFPKIDSGGLRQAASARIATGTAATQANIKQAGAAGRLPAGAITSALALSNSRQSAVDPQLDQQLLNIQQFNAGQETRAGLANQQRYEDIVNLNLAGLGTLSKLAILNKYGLINGGGGANAAE